MEEKMVYIGIKKCGCVVAACVDMDDKKEVAKHISDFIRQGLTIERISVEETRNRLRSCKCGEQTELVLAERAK